MFGEFEKAQQREKFDSSFSQLQGGQEQYLRAPTPNPHLRAHLLTSGAFLQPHSTGG